MRNWSRQAITWPPPTFDEPTKLLERVTLGGTFMLVTFPAVFPFTYSTPLPFESCVYAKWGYPPVEIDGVLTNCVKEAPEYTFMASEYELFPLFCNCMNTLLLATPLPKSNTSKVDWVLPNQNHMETENAPPLK